MASRYFEIVDTKLTELLSTWNITTTVLCLGFAAVLLYPVLFPSEPDAHPFLLLRQSVVSPVRQPGESAVYRSPETPHGAPLKSGFNVKDASAPQWTPGRDGDLRDVWKKFSGLDGRADITGDGPVQTGKIITVLGKERAVQHDLATVSKSINGIGSHINDNGGKRVALYLPNSIEVLVVLFAAAFYGFSVVLVPYHLPAKKVAELLKQIQPDVLIAEAGSLPLKEITAKVNSLGLVVWVVEETSRHMDWQDVPSDVGGKIEVLTYHELEENRQRDEKVYFPTSEDGYPITRATVYTAWSVAGATFQITEFSQANLISAAAALTTALPHTQRLDSNDVFLSAEHISHNHALTQTLAALFARATIVLNSVAGPTVDLRLATAGTNGPPATVLLASAASTAALAHHVPRARALAPVDNDEDELPDPPSALAKWALHSRARVLADGRLTACSALGERFISGPHPTPPLRAPPLRLLLVSARAPVSPLLSTDGLNVLRAALRARVVLALTAPQAAGVIAQAHAFDYRAEKVRAGGAAAGAASGPGPSRFGPPVASVELKIVLTSDGEGGDSIEKDGPAVGKIVISGPAVAGSTAVVDVSATFADDGTLALV